ncbi:unnamed protein product [Symbiodinium natans]|uniref:Uncharacterized protein n=1 Tax=Symbiodinium natans TaxID=878477 RepID=A0A812PMJ3_9DINO|nr:unnamed protein product [Symbiodinium natans]
MCGILDDVHAYGGQEQQGHGSSVLGKFGREDLRSGRVHAVIADGAVQKALKLLRFALPNVALIARDSCHVQRIAASDPLKRDSCTLPKLEILIVIFSVSMGFLSGGMGQRWRASKKWRYELQLVQSMKQWTGLSTV